MECLGVHVLPGRVHPNERTVRNAIKKAREMNKCIRPSKVATLLSSLNSYMGIFGHWSGFKAAEKVAKALSPKWYEYIEFDRDNAVFRAKKGYQESERIIKKYNLK